MLTSSLLHCCSVMFNSLQPHRLQHTRILCPLLSPRVFSDSCPLSQWCYPTISSSAASFSFCLQFFTASVFFPMSWLFTSGGQSIEPSALASVLPVNIQGWFSFRIDWFDLLAVQGTLKSLLQHHDSKASILWGSAFSMIQLSHPYITIGKSITLTRYTFISKVISLLFNMLSWFVITFLPRIKHLLILYTLHSYKFLFLVLKKF